MAIETTINGNRYRFDSKDILGEGGEAEIFRFTNDVVAKLYKLPTHISFEGDRSAQIAAKARIEEHQTKLRDFPAGLPKNVIAPKGLVYDASGMKVLGYTMDFLSNAEVLLRYCERKFRETKNISDDRIVNIFSSLYSTIGGVHNKNVVIGDFNDLNVMVGQGDDVSIIDADSMQFGPYLSKVFTTRFVDPLLCDFSSGEPVLCKPHNPNSDWYAYAVMLMKALIYAGPYSGVHIPKAGDKRLSDGARVQKRVTVFSDDIRFPKVARHYSVLPPELLGHFEDIFVKNARSPIPLSLIQDIRFTTCPNCKKEHARSSCPDCQPIVDIAVKEVISGNVEALKVLDTFGRILHACIQGGVPKFVYNEQGGYFREGAKSVIKGEIDPQFKIRIAGKYTVISKGGTVIFLDENGNVEHKVVADCYRGKIPTFATSGKHVFIAEGGHLRRYGGVLGMKNPEHIGEVIEGQTLLWAGDKLGFVFYQAGEIMRAHVFGVERTSLGVEIKIPKLRGVMIDATCTFSSDFCWFFVTTDDKGILRNRVFMISHEGKIVGEAEAVKGDGSWLESIHGFCATNKFLFASTDEGIARVECSQTLLLEETKSYTATARFVNSGTKLLFGNDGIYAVSNKSIWRIKMK